MISRRGFLQKAGKLTLGVSVLSPFLSFGKNLGREHSLSRYYKAAYTMGTVMTVEAFAEKADQCERAVHEAIDEVKRIDRLMSVFDSSTQLSTVNQMAGKSDVQVDGRLVDVLESSLFYYGITDGAFDPTIEPLMELWGFRDRERSRKPTDRELHRTAEAVGAKNVSIDRRNSTVALLRERSKLDLGGIAVGYAVDRAVGILRRHGVEIALINHSGDIYALGSPPDEDGWLVGITDPQHPEETITSTRVKDKAISTSGNYENYVNFDGVHYGHILNPRTGEPSSTVISSTVIANTALEADALSTGIFVMGVQRGLKLVESLKNVDLIAITQNEGREEVISSF